MKFEEKVFHVTKRLKATDKNNKEQELKVQKIKKLKKVGMYEVLIDSEKLVVSDEIIVKYSLINDRILSYDEYQEIRKDITNENILRKVYNYISFQNRSMWEVENYLREQNCENELINKIIIKLIEKEFIDDDRYSLLLLESAKRNLKGPAYYEMKIKEKHVYIIYEYTKEEEEKVIDEKIAKIYDLNSTKPVIKQKQLLYQKLIRDGFTSSLVNKKINCVEFIDNSNEKISDDVRKAYNRYNNKGNNWKNKMISSLLNKGYNYNDIIKSFNEIKES